MNRKRVIAGLAVVVLGTALYALLRLARRPATGAEEEGSPTLVAVQVGKLTRATLHDYVDGFGTVAPAPAEAGQPPATAHVAPSVAGIVARALVAEGQRVERGTLLFELDPRAADVAVNYARETVARQKRLFADHNTSLRSLQDAEAQLAAAEAQLALLRVTAPLSGTVTHVGVRPGEAVDLTTVLADIIDLTRLVVAANIPSAEAGKLKPGQRVQVLTDPPVATVLAYVGAAVDATNDTVAVRAPLPPGSALRPGQLVPLRIVTAELANCLAAPAASVVTDGGGRSVVAVVAGDEATQVVVTTGLREAGLIAIEGPGLKEGDTVVTVGAYGLPAKTKVQVLAP
jgi:membrane fusion protein (multidrug efflux system)